MMLMDHPLMGAGPGGFQSLYLQYRLPVANETISDPHNFLVETLATGGFVAGVLLVLIFIVVIRYKRLTGSTEAETLAKTAADSSAPWIGYGGGVSLLLIWFFALLSGRLPDFQAGMFAVPIAIAAGVLIQTQLRHLPSDDLRRISTTILIAIMVHLIVSGGWTVPGVAIFIWLCTASICHTDVAARPSNHHGANKASLMAIAVGLTLLASLRFFSIVPVQQSQLAILRAEDSMVRGVHRRAESESRLAVDADGWGFEAARWQSELWRSRLVNGTDDAGVRNEWQTSMETVINRSGSDPLLRRALGEQCLHVYQVFGQPSDLAQANRFISDALARNPTDLSLVAQASIIALEAGDLKKSRSLAEETRRLSDLRDNIVLDLGLQQIMVVKKVGPIARQRPQLSSIKTQFRDRLGSAGEPASDQRRSNETERDPYF